MKKASRFNESLASFRELYENIIKQQSDFPTTNALNYGERVDFFGSVPIDQTLFSKMEAELAARLDYIIENQTSTKLFDDIQYAEALLDNLKRVNDKEKARVPPLPPYPEESPPLPPVLPKDLPPPPILPGSIQPSIPFRTGLTPVTTKQIDANANLIRQVLALEDFVKKRQPPKLQGMFEFLLEKRELDVSYDSAKFKKIREAFNEMMDQFWIDSATLENENGMAYLIRFMDQLNRVIHAYYQVRRLFGIQTKEEAEPDPWRSFSLFGDKIPFPSDK